MGHACQSWQKFASAGGPDLQYSMHRWRWKAPDPLDKAACATRSKYVLKSVLCWRSACRGLPQSLIPCSRERVVCMWTVVETTVTDRAAGAGGNYPVALFCHQLTTTLNVCMVSFLPTRGSKSTIATGGLKVQWLYCSCSTKSVSRRHVAHGLAAGTMSATHAYGEGVQFMVKFA